MNDPSAANWITVNDRLEELAKAQAALDYDVGRWLLAAHRLDVHAHLGRGSFGEYAIALFGRGLGSVSERLRVAREVEELPGIKSALCAGDINWSTVRELTRVAEPDTEGDWLEVARGRTCREVESLVSGLARGDLPGARKRREKQRHLLRLEVTAETMATFREAVMKLQRETGEGLDDETALLMMARGALEGSRSGMKDTGGAKAGYQIALTKCPECERGQQQGRGELVDIGSDILEMAECDAQYIGDPTTSQPQRATRTIPPAIRRQVIRRDHGQCVVPGCRCATFIDLHHIRLRSENGDHDPDLIICLCGAHHRAVHRGTLWVTGRVSTGLMFEHADGTRYGGRVSPRAAEAGADVFVALRGLGFGESETRRAIMAAGQVQGGASDGFDELMRRALRSLVPTPVASSGPSMVREPVAPYLHGGSHRSKMARLAG
jgi:hypothetical protein